MHVKVECIMALSLCLIKAVLSQTATVQQKSTLDLFPLSSNRILQLTLPKDSSGTSTRTCLFYLLSWVIVFLRSPIFTRRNKPRMAEVARSRIFKPRTEETSEGCSSF